MTAARSLLRGGLTAGALAVAACGCLHVPSPLAPSVHGSVGTPSHGVLTDAAMLPKSGTGYRWLTASGQHFGTQELVQTVELAARQVHHIRPDAPALLVGDLSAKAGGKLARHASHRTGRDVDLLFFVTDLEGNPIESPGWVRFEADGLGEVGKGAERRFIRFDVERNWLLVKALLTTRDVQALWLFVSRPLEAILIEYARARGEDPELIWKAESVLHQPSHAEPHDDHFHLRIACTPEMAVAGCDDTGGPLWPWLHEEPRLAWPQSEEGIAKEIGIAESTLVGSR